METQTVETPVAVASAPVIKKRSKITLTAFKPRTQMPCTIRPLEKGKGKLYTGQGKAGIFEALTKDEKEQLGELLIDRHTSIIISDGMVLDLDDPIDAAHWGWMQVHPYIAKDKRSGSSNNDAVFYVNDPEKDATERIRTSRTKDQARAKVYDLSHTKLQEAARVLGLSGAAEFSADFLTGWLLDQAEISPESLLLAIDPSHAARNKAKVMFNEAMRYQIFTKTEKGTLNFSGTEMGFNEETVLTWLLDEKNSQTVKVISTKVIEAKKI